jgi:hypothetical protein
MDSERGNYLTVFGIQPFLQHHILPAAPKIPRLSRTIITFFGLYSSYMMLVNWYRKSPDRDKIQFWIATLLAVGVAQLIIGPIFSLLFVLLLFVLISSDRSN